ncbi:Sugar or nucleoside kinase, ribokinase family [Devosia enhydra]|uniref:Sugar or nucleoside kinase, ribokinase family n=1 Tax=Devosia enhydra TaxID=665118 RepID=A0A1K2I2A0_9HYPH|nr:sugar kinase [Devosia enhydra]SFZ86347.1 Sugar or nucleoside kinase, ribokinase family [Devosia enhydra]
MSGAGVVVIGDVMTDIIVRPEGPLRRGSDRRATISRHAGGSGANQAAWLASAGVDTVLVARVGEGDAAGLETHFRSIGVVPYLGRDRERPTGTLINIIDPDGERSFLTDRGANLGLCDADLPPNLYQEGAAVLVSGYSLFAEGPRRAVMRFMAQARAAGLLVAVDPSSAGFLEDVGPQVFLDWVSGADLVFANAEEAALLSGEAEPEAQAAALANVFATVIIKRGAEGAIAAVGGRLTSARPREALQVVDSTGAGDAFAAGYLACRLRGGEVDACLATGVALGGQAVMQVGGQPAIGVVPVHQFAGNQPFMRR